MHRIALLSISLVFSAATLGCASHTLSGVDEPDFGEVVRHYRTLASKKALALATEANGRWSYGVRFASGSREEAIEEALEGCRARARSGGMRARCLLFAIENDPAPDTIAGCYAGMVPSRRCHMQRRHQGILSEPR
jgi:hypothetical protein